MSVLKQISVVILLFIQFSIASPRLITATSNTQKVFRTNANIVKISLETDATEINYQLSKEISSGKAILQKQNRLNVANPTNAILKREISLGNLAEGTFQLQLDLYDQVVNHTQIEQLRIIVDRTAPQLDLLHLYLAENKIYLDFNATEEATLTFSSQASGTESLQVQAGRQNIAIFENWLVNQNYQFQFFLTDLAGNQSKVETGNIKTPEVTGGAGELFGVSADQPWGKDNSVTNQISKTDLVIDLSQKEIHTELHNPNLAPLVITSAKQIASGWQVYLLTPPQNGRLAVSISLRTASYFQALQLCGLSELYRMVKPFLTQDINCISKRMYLSSLNSFWATTQAICAQFFWPWDNLTCLQKLLNQAEEKFYALQTVSLATTVTSILNNEHKTLALLKNLPGQAQFELTAKLVPTNRLIQASTQAWSAVSFENQLIPINLASSLSNFYQLLALTPNASQQCANSACLVLDVPYTNQWVNSKGKYQSWAQWPKNAGGQSCGATSSVMSANFSSKFTADSDLLQSYIYQDKGQNLQNKKCQRPGAFAVTASDSDCNQSSFTGITNYLKQNQLHTKMIWPDQTNLAKLLTERIIPGLRQNHLFILSYKKPIGHILLIKGFTYNSKIIVNDPYRDFQNNYKKGVYDYSGKSAIYELRPNANYQLNYLIEIYQ